MFTALPTPTTFTIGRYNEYTDAFGLNQVEIVPRSVLITRWRSVTRELPIDRVHPMYLTSTGCVAAMIRDIQRNDHHGARFYRDYAISEAHTSRAKLQIARVWNLAVTPKPELP